MEAEIIYIYVLKQTKPHSLLHTIWASLGSTEIYLSRERFIFPHLAGEEEE